MASDITAHVAYERQEVGEYEDAVRLYQEALAIHETSARNWFNLGSSHLRLGQIEEARRAIERAAALDANDPTFRKALDLLPPESVIR